MMNLNKTYSLLLTALLILPAACTPEAVEPSGAITLTFSSSDLETRAIGNGDLSDGGGIKVTNQVPDLAIAIANSSGDLVAWYPDDFWGTMATGYSSTLITQYSLSATNATESTVSITGPGRGAYTVFAIANLEGVSAAMKSSIQAADSIDELEALYLETASGQPGFGSLMPLSAKGSLSVNSNGKGQVDLELLRPVARVSLTFKNETGEALDIHASRVVIYKMNPSRGYLFPMDTDNISGSNGEYERDLVITGADPLVFDSSTNKSTLPYMLVYPSIAPAQTIGSRYLCDISFRVTNSEKVYNSADSSTYTEYTFPDLPVHDSRSSDIPCLKRNQHLKIETRINKRASQNDISFNFEVQGWTEREGYLTFD